MRNNVLLILLSLVTAIIYMYKNQKYQVEPSGKGLRTKEIAVRNEDTGRKQNLWINVKR